MRQVGDLEIAEDAVQEACAAALDRWAEAGIPEHPRAWLVATARHKALDWQRREARRFRKEDASMREQSRRGRPASASAGAGAGPIPDDELALIFLCCHPALDLAVRVPLTLRAVCGLTTAQIAAAFLVPQPTMAQRLVRTKRKIREAGIAFRVPPAEAFTERLEGVLRVVYLVFTEGHRASTGERLVRPELCEQAIRLARSLVALLPGQPEVAGLLALLLLVDARRPARVDAAGDLVLLADQDRGLWDRGKIEEGAALVERALRARRPGPYQLQAAIAACHSTSPIAEATDWTEIAALYEQLLLHEPTPVVEANRAVAVAMAQGPAAGLAILDELGSGPALGRWSQLQVARADLLSRIGRHAEANDAYRRALELGPPSAERAFLLRRLGQSAVLAGLPQGKDEHGPA
jgi:RNA polymerase sigma-70 factor, ECF subfamily